MAATMMTTMMPTMTTICTMSQSCLQQLTPSSLLMLAGKIPLTTSEEDQHLLVSTPSKCDSHTLYSESAVCLTSAHNKYPCDLELQDPANARSEEICRLASTGVTEVFFFAFPNLLVA